MHPHTEKMPRKFKSDAQHAERKRSAEAKRQTQERRAIRRAKREGAR